MQRAEHALNDFLDSTSGRDDLDSKTAQAMKTLTDAISTPDGVDY